MTEEKKEGVEELDAHTETAKEAKKPGHLTLMTVVAAATVVAACSIGAVVGQTIAEQGAAQQTKPAESQQASQSTASAAADAHQAAEHVWQAVYGTVHVEKQTHMEHKDTTYKQETVNETVCNDCKAVITGKAQEHIEKTGHSGFTRNVPVIEDVIDVPAHDEEVVDWEAHDEKRLTGYSCECGKNLTLDEAKEAGVYSASDENQGDKKTAGE